jgi:hypothetical protein
MAETQVNTLEHAIERLKRLKTEMDKYPHCDDPRIVSWGAQEYSDIFHGVLYHMSSGLTSSTRQVNTAAHRAATTPFPEPVEEGTESVGATGSETELSDAM